jgi:predicted O-methyltransferase YrrM
MSDHELLPMMDPIEWSQIMAIVHAVGPRRMLEWGSGGSTRAILAASPFIETYVSVEHDRGWYERVKSAVTDPRLLLLHVPPDVPPTPGSTPEQLMAWDDRAEVEPELMASYVVAPRVHVSQLDLVFVDGRARCFCMRSGFQMLRPGGVLVLHDAQRTEYHATARELGRALFLEPYRAGQVCLVRKPD